MDIYMKYKNDLRDFQYPNINTFTDEEIQDLFSVKNRFLLFSWLVNKLNSAVELPMECSKSAETIIADYLYETGFCSLSEKLPFVQRTCSVDDDIKIFDRIFCYLSNILQSTSMESFENNSINASIEDFLNKDINLFPAVRTLRVFNQEERENKLLSYNENIQKLKELTNKNIGSGNNNVDLDDPIFQDSAISSNMEGFKEHIKNLSKAASIIKKTSKPVEIGNSFEPNFTSELKKCCNVIKPALQHFNNMNLMKSLNDDLNDNGSTIQNDEVLETVKNIAENFSRVAKLLDN